MIKLKSMDSNIKTLFITGLSSLESYNTGNAKVYALKGQRHFMMKPISKKELLEQVYSIINLHQAPEYYINDLLIQL